MYISHMRDEGALSGETDIAFVAFVRLLSRVNAHVTNQDRRFVEIKSGAVSGGLAGFLLHAISQVLL